MSTQVQPMLPLGPPPETPESHADGLLSELAAGDRIRYGTKVYLGHGWEGVNKWVEAEIVEITLRARNQVPKLTVKVLRSWGRYPAQPGAIVHPIPSGMFDLRRVTDASPAPAPAPAPAVDYLW